MAVTTSGDAGGTTTADKPKTSDQVKQPDSATVAVQNASDLTNPGNSALATQMRAGDNGTGLPGLDISQRPGTTASAPKLDEATLTISATQLHEAIAKKDQAAVQHLLQPLTVEDRQALAAIYHKKYDPNGDSNTLLNELNRTFGTSDFLKDRQLLTASGNGTNDAGQMALVLKKLTDAKGDDRALYNYELREILMGLNAPDRDRLRREFAAQNNNQDLFEAIKSNKNLSDSTKQTLELLAKGTDRTKEDNIEIARIAVQKGDLDLLGQALRGNGTGAEARAALQKDGQFVASMQEKFKNNLDIANDYLKQGVISLATITDKNNYTAFLAGKNEKNLELALRNATDEEKAKYQQGRELQQQVAQGKLNPNDLPESERNRLDFYNKLHGALERFAGGNETAISAPQRQTGDYVLQNVLNVKPEELPALLNDQKALDDRINKIGGSDKDIKQVLALHILEQYRASGKFDKLSPVDQVLFDKITPGVSVYQREQNIEAALKADPALRQRLWTASGEGRDPSEFPAMQRKNPAFGDMDRLSDIDKAFNNVVWSTMQELRTKDPAGVGDITAGTRRLVSLAYQNGEIPLADRQRLQFPTETAKENSTETKIKVARWEDDILNGGSFMQAVLTNPKSVDSIMSSVEQMDERTWNRLHGPEKDNFLRDLDANMALAKVDEQTQKKVRELIDAKLTAPDFESSTQIKRSLLELVDEVPKDQAQPRLVEAIQHMRPDEALRYKNDAAFRDQVNKAVLGKLDGYTRDVAQEMLAQVEKTGQPADINQLSSERKLWYDRATNADHATILRDAERYLTEHPEQREKFRALWGGDGNYTSPNIATQKNWTRYDYDMLALIDGAGVQMAAEKNAGKTGEFAVQYSRRLRESLYEKGQIPIEQKLSLNLPKSDIYEQLAKASPEEQQRVLKEGRWTPQERELAEKIIRQKDEPGGPMRLEDKIRSYVIDGEPPYSSFEHQLEELSKNPAAIQKLKTDYAAAFRSDIDGDLLGKIGDSNKDFRRFQLYLSPEKGDGRQDLYDNLEETFKHLSGFSPDGSELTLQRANQLYSAQIQEFEKQYLALDPTKRKELDALFQSAVDDYVNGKKEYSEKLVNFTQQALTYGLVIGTVALSGGTMAPAAIALLSMSSGALRVAAQAAIEGKDFDSSFSNIIKQDLLGTGETLINFIGPEAIGPLTGLSRQAATHAAGALTPELITTLGAGGTKQLENQLTRLYVDAAISGKPLTKDALQSVARASLPEAARNNPQVVEALTQALVNSSSKEVMDTLSTALPDVLKTWTRQTAFDAGLGGFLGAVSTVGLSPLNGGFSTEGLEASVLGGVVGGAGFSVLFRTGAGAFGRVKESLFSANRKPDGGLEFSSTEPHKITIRDENGKDVEIQIKPNERATLGKGTIIAIDGEPVTSGLAIRRNPLKEGSNEAPPVVQGEGTTSKNIPGGREITDTKTGTTVKVNDVAKPIEINSPAGKTTFSYDNEGKLTSITRPDGTAITYNKQSGTYEVNGQTFATKLTAVRPDGTMEFEVAPSARIDYGPPAGKVRGEILKPDGTRIELLEADGTPPSRSSVNFDAKDRVTSLTDKNESAISFGYPSESQIARRELPNDGRPAFVDLPGQGIQGPDAPGSIKLELRKQSDGSFKYEYADEPGRVFADNVSIQPNGTVRFSGLANDVRFVHEPGKPLSAIEYRLDGSMELKYADGSVDDPVGAEFYPLRPRPDTPLTPGETRAAASGSASPGGAKIDVMPGQTIEFRGKKYTAGNPPYDEKGNLNLDLRDDGYFRPEVVKERIAPPRNPADKFDEQGNPIPGQTYKFWRESKGVEEEWTFRVGPLWTRETSIKVPQQSLAEIAGVNGLKLKLGDYELGQRVQLAGGQGKVVGFDGGDAVVYAPRPGRPPSEAVVVTGDLAQQGYRSVDLRTADGGNYVKGPDGRFYRVENGAPGAERSWVLTAAPDYVAVDHAGPYAPQIRTPAVEPNDTVDMNGQKGRVLAVDGNTALIYVPQENVVANPRSQIVPVQDFNNNYTPVNIDGVNYYRNGEKVYVATPQGEHAYKLTEVNEFTFRQLDGPRAPEWVPEATYSTRAIEHPSYAPVPLSEAPRLPGYGTIGQGGYAQRYDLPGYDKGRVTFDGQPIDRDPRVAPIEIGRAASNDATIPDNNFVSARHATVAWDAEKQMYYIEDHSSNGTEIKRPGDSDFTKFGGNFRPDGTREPVRKYLGPEDEIRIGGKIIRLDLPNVQPNAVPPALRNTDTQVYVAGQSVPIENNVIHLGADHPPLAGNRDALNRLVSRDHADLIRNPETGAWTLVDHTRPNVNGAAAPGATVMANVGEPNGSYVLRNGNWIQIRGNDPNFPSSIELRDGDIVRLGSKNGPEIKIQTTPGQPQPDGTVVFQRKNLETAVKRPDGFTEVTSRFGTKRIEDPQGNVVQAVDKKGRAMAYEYSEPGKLSKITFADGSVATPQDGQWVRTTGDGKTETWWKGDVSIEPDGSVKYSDKQGRVQIDRLDGTREVVRPDGRVEYQNVDFLTELGYLRGTARNADFLPTRERQERFVQMLGEAEARIKTDFRRRGLSNEAAEKEIAQTYHQIRRLLEAGDGSPIPAERRAQLAEQLLYNVTHPELISQGANPTCNVTTIEQRIFSKNPSEAVRLVTDVATTGKYVTAEGKVIDQSRIPGILDPDSESRGVLGAAFGGDLRADGQRNYASQIFEQTAVNIKYNEQSGPFQTTLYEKRPGLPGQDVPELAVYSVDPVTGELRRTVRGDSPQMTAADLQGVSNSITGERETGFVFSGPRTPRGDVMTPATFRGAAEVPQNFAEFQRMVASKNESDFPLVLFVWADHPFFGGNGQNSDGRGHFVTIKNVREVAPGQYVADVYNQWTAGNNISNVPLDRVWDFMQPAGYRTPPPTQSPSTPTFPTQPTQPTQPIQPNNNGIFRRLFGR